MGAAIGSSDFRKLYATEKVNNWCEEINKFSEYAKTQPHHAQLIQHFAMVIYTNLDTS